VRQLPGICTLLVSHNLIIFVQQQVCFYRTTASVHPNSHKRTHNSHARTHAHQRVPQSFTDFLYTLLITTPAQLFSLALQHPTGSFWIYSWIYIHFSDAWVCMSTCLSLWSLSTLCEIFTPFLIQTCTLLYDSSVSFMFSLSWIINWLGMRFTSVLWVRRKTLNDVAQMQKHVSVILFQKHSSFRFRLSNLKLWLRFFYIFYRTAGEKYQDGGS